MFRKIFTVSLMALLSLVLAACGGDAGGSDAPVAPSSDGPALTQEVSSSGEGVVITALLPEGWIVETEGQIIGATRQELIDGGSGLEANPGDMLVAISALPAEIASFMIPDGEVSPRALVETFSQFMIDNPETTEAGEVEDVTVGDVQGAKINVTSPGGTITVYSIERDGAYIVMVAGSERSETASRAPLFEAILANVTVTVDSAE